jgi:branched-chain amino acid transport system ATP-binding protein
MPLLSVRGLRAGYGKSEILRGLEFDVQPRETVVLLGANGCGKSTSLNVITGFLAPTAGQVLFDGEDIAGMPTHRTFARGVVQVSQKRDLFPEMSVEDNLRLGGFAKLSALQTESGLDREGLVEAGDQLVRNATSQEDLVRRIYL